ncbi:unnamed protein product [Leptidea sinapis]|uniref:Uncharacterized protein n=1 Tax=Leptidea sinapis TaxID=189913 RepID=A0A5E4R161_9NEOP|nr:unnamed protein product [Leptidea sinapis]
MSRCNKQQYYDVNLGKGRTTCVIPSVIRANLNDEWAKSMIDASVLNIPIATPAPLNSFTTCLIGDPDGGI